MNLVITEKPSQAQSYAAVLGAKERGNGFLQGGSYIVTWCFGHLLELAAPEACGDYANWRYSDLPIIPQEWKHVPAKDKATQLKTVAVLMNRVDVDCVINAADAGREGEIIFRNVYEYAKCRKPVKRLWISSMEDAAVGAGFDNLKDVAEYDNLYAAASCRERADWLVGISATRLFSVLYGGATLNTGRVQSPTLAMITEREAAIAGFVSTPFYTVELDAGGFSASSGRFSDRAGAESLMAGCAQASVTAVKQTEKSIAPPKLHDLTALQRECNRAHGYTAQQTLDYIQSLYEKKLATYPRTDSRYLTPDMAATVTALVAALAPGAPCDISRVIDPARVSDHHAVLPTAAGVTADLSALPVSERAVLDMLKARLVCAVGEPHRYLEIAVTLTSGGAEFTAKGKKVLHDGWKATATPLADDDADGEPPVLPGVAEGLSFPVTPSVKEGATAPPKHYTEDTLLAGMAAAGAEGMLAGGLRPEDAERKGLGTPATRAGIIEKLVKSGFIERQKKNLLPTEKGKNLIAVLPDALKSPALTAEWESRLLAVQHGELAASAFMNSIAEFMRGIVRDNSAPIAELLPLFANSARPSPAPIGVCPRCAGAVREGTKGFFCDNRACGFKLWKNAKFWTAKKKPLTVAIVAALLKDGRAAVKGLRSEKTGKPYDATVVLDDTRQYVNFKLEFEGKGKAQ